MKRQPTDKEISTTLIRLHHIALLLMECGYDLESAAAIKERYANQHGGADKILKEVMKENRG